MPSDRLEGVALVTGGGRGIGASIARELADAGMRVAVTGRTREQIDAVADEIGGLALEGDVSNADDVGRWVETAERELGPIELLVANAGIGHQGTTWSVPVEDWWRVFEINVLGVHLSCRAVVPSMLERASGRVVITGSGAAYLPGSSGTAYSASKAAVCRYGETLANELRGPHPRLLLQPWARPHGVDGALRRRPSVDAARSGSKARARARVGSRRRARRPLPARRARRHRGSHPPSRRRHRERPQRDPASALT